MPSRKRRGAPTSILLVYLLTRLFIPSSLVQAQYYPPADFPGLLSRRIHERDFRRFWGESSNVKRDGVSHERHSSVYISPTTAAISTPLQICRFRRRVW